MQVQGIQILIDATEEDADKLFATLVRSLDSKKFENISSDIQVYDMEVADDYFDEEDDEDEEE